MATDKPKFTVIVDNELMKAIDDFRFENRYMSRSAAAADILRLGLEALKKEKADPAYLCGEAAAYGGESANVKTTEEKLKELYRMKGETEEQ